MSNQRKNRKLVASRARFINSTLAKLAPYLRQFIINKGLEPPNKWDCETVGRYLAAITKIPYEEKKARGFIEYVNSLVKNGILPDKCFHRLSESKPKSGTSTRKTKINSDKALDFYASYEWRKLRYTILVKYGRKCMCCGAEKGVMHVDHIKPLRKNWHLRLDPKNMQVLCAQCNHGKGNWDETDFRPNGNSYEEDFIKNYVKKYVLKEDSVDKDTQYRLKLIKEQLSEKYQNDR